jgi:FRG domain
MNGQWIGEYSGTNEGTLVVDLDDAGKHFDGSAIIIETKQHLPPTFASFSQSPVPKGKTEFKLEVRLAPVDPVSGEALPPKVVEQRYPGATMARVAQTRWKVIGEKIEVSWETDVGTSGKGILGKSKGDQPSTLMPDANITDWDGFRRFARELEPYRYVFRGQRNNTWRLRTSFHRENRSSLHKFMLQDIPVLQRHLSGMMKDRLDIRDPLQNAAFYNLLQHHGYPTPLLDWTYSPFVAAYFAYRGVREATASEQRIRLFVFDKQDWCHDYETIPYVCPPKLHFTVVEPLALNNPRVVPQQSVSSVTNIEDIETYLVRKEKQLAKRYLFAIDLPVSERDIVMRELGLMGITAGSLFPGIEGACEELRERFFRT